MTNKPLITVLVPWKYSRIAKSAQIQARDHDRVHLRGNREGLRVTATVQDYVRLGLGRQSDELSDPVVGRLRNIKVPVQASRTVHLPGGVTAVEIQARVAAPMAERLMEWAGRQATADVLTIYDQDGVGHTGRAAGLERKGAEVEEATPKASKEVRREGRRRVRAAEDGKHAGLVTAIRDIWEKDGEDMAQLIDWDMSEYEAPEVQDLVMGVLPQYLTDDKLDEWNSLDAETQSYVMRQAFPVNALKTTMENLDQHFDNQTRGASRTLQARVDPLDLGTRDPLGLVKVNGRKSINHLFS